MTPQSITTEIRRPITTLRLNDTVLEAARRIVAAKLPALPIVDDRGRLSGIFGEREFIGALFPGYLGELHSAAFVPGSIEDVLEKRVECRLEPVSKYANTEKIAVGVDHSDVQVAETFLHHRVLIVPIVDADERPVGIVSRWEFFKALVERAAQV